MIRFNEAIEKIMGKFVTDLQFRNSVLQTPNLTLGQEGLMSTAEINQLIAKLKNVSPNQLEIFKDGPEEVEGRWTN